MPDFPIDDPAADFETLSNLFVRLNTFSSPSELHGLTCGVICAGFLPNNHEWLKMVGAHLQLDAIPNDMEPKLVGFYGQSCAQLMEPGFEFEPLLPSDDYHLEQRLEALVDWCNGFLHGFGAMFNEHTRPSLAAKTIDKRLPDLDEQTQSILHDLSDIAKVQVDDSESWPDEMDEDNERHYTEVFEYVRVATLTLLAEHGAHNTPLHHKQAHSLH